MRKKLIKINYIILFKIAADLGRPCNSLNKAIDNIIEVCKEYGFKYKDLQIRFNLPD